MAKRMTGAELAAARKFAAGFAGRKRWTPSASAVRLLGLVEAERRDEQQKTGAGDAG